MAVEVEESNMKNILENLSNTKVEENQEDDFVDDKVHVFETAVIVGNVELKDQIIPDKITQYKVSTFLNNIKTELSSSPVQYDMIEKVKVEKLIGAKDIKIEFNNRLLYCEYCHTYYGDYCIKCGMLVHILNRIVLNTPEDRAREELPNDILEIHDSSGQIGIFALKVIPEGVKFGPFTGLSRSQCSWKIKGGKFIVNEHERKCLNWMQYVNPARDAPEQNLLVFQYEDNLYYRSTCQIQAGAELMVYFGEEYDDSLVKNAEMDLIPTTEHIVKDEFVCTWCCLGFNSKSYLAKHKTKCPERATEFNSCPFRAIPELTQCPSCKIYLDQKEYLKHHMACYCNRNIEKSVPPSNHPVEVNGLKTHPRSQMYKRERCKYKTKYKENLKSHTKRHYQVHTLKCGVCKRRFKTKKLLNQHVESSHIYASVKNDPERSTGEYVDAYVKVEHSNLQDDKIESLCEVRTKYEHYIKEHTRTKHLKKFNYKCDDCDFKTNNKTYLEVHRQKKHLTVFTYKCRSCQYRTNCKANLETHIKTKHLKVFTYKCRSCQCTTNHKASLKRHIKAKHGHEFSYECKSCQYKTNRKASLEIHMKTNHLDEFRYECRSCQYRTNNKSNLERHVKTKHLKEFSYECGSCRYMTNYKKSLEIHIKTKHLEEFSYECGECRYKTNNKLNLKIHIKTKHLEQFRFKCESCDFKSNNKTNMEIHIKTKHLEEFSYECGTCRYKTNRKSSLDIHTKIKHLKALDHECDICQYKTNLKSNLERHRRSKHLKEFNYKCESCKFKTNDKAHLEIHVKTKHLKEFDYGCDLCDYKTNRMSDLRYHIRRKHVKALDYKCDNKTTNEKGSLKINLKLKHPDESDCKVKQEDYFIIS